jgi:hypothetical protein
MVLGGKFGSSRSVRADFARSTSSRSRVDCLGEANGLKAATRKPLGGAGREWRQFRPGNSPLTPVPSAWRIALFERRAPIDPATFPQHSTTLRATRNGQGLSHGSGCQPMERAQGGVRTGLAPPAGRLTPYRFYAHLARWPAASLWARVGASMPVRTHARPRLCCPMTAVNNIRKTSSRGALGISGSSRITTLKNIGGTSKNDRQVTHG